MTLLNGASASVDLDRSLEDREEEVIVREYFGGSPCCVLGPKKGPCGTHAGRQRFLHARQESLDLEKKELDLVVLATLHASSSLPKDPSSQLTITPLGSGEVQFFQSFFKPIPGNFKVSKAEPGIVAVKEYTNSPEVKIAKRCQCNFSSGTTTK